MKFWLSADHHFRHGNIIEYCKRPFESTYHMDTEMIRRWNERVAMADSVLYLGDFCFGEHTEILNKLNGNIIFIKGSHDSGIRTILTGCYIRYGGLDFYCSHEPDFKIKYNLCGHVHEKWKARVKGAKIVINVGVDQWDFYPIDINQILKELNDRGWLSERTKSDFPDLR